MSIDQAVIGQIFNGLSQEEINLALAGSTFTLKSAVRQTKPYIGFNRDTRYAFWSETTRMWGAKLAKNALQIAPTAYPNWVLNITELVDISDDRRAASRLKAWTTDRPSSLFHVIPTAGVSTLYATITNAVNPAHAISNSIAAPDDLVKTAVGQEPLVFEIEKMSPYLTSLYTKHLYGVTQPKCDEHQFDVTASPSSCLYARTATANDGLHGHVSQLSGRIGRLSNELTEEQETNKMLMIAVVVIVLLSVVAIVMLKRRSSAMLSQGFAPMDASPTPVSF